jgi:drug/metabolite transporter (DMT)-like permease
MGFIGIFILSYPNIHLQSSSFIGEMAIVLSALSFAISLVLMKSLPPISPTIQMRNILGLASIPLLVVVILQNMLVAHYSVASLISLLILGVFCTGIVYLMFIILIQRTTSTFASLTNYLIPLVGVIVGNFIMHENVTWYEILSLIIILAALLINQITYRS